MRTVSFQLPDDIEQQLRRDLGDLVRLRRRRPSSNSIGKGNFRTASSLKAWEYLDTKPMRC